MTDEEILRQGGFSEDEIKGAPPSSPDTPNAALYPSVARKEAIPGFEGPYLPHELPARAAQATEFWPEVVRNVPGALAAGVLKDPRAVGMVQAGAQVAAKDLLEFLQTPDVQSYSDRIKAVISNAKIEDYAVEGLSGYASGYGGQKYAAPAVQSFLRDMANIAYNAPRDIKDWAIGKLAGTQRARALTPAGQEASNAISELAANGEFYALTPRQAYGFNTRWLTGGLEDSLRALYGSRGMIEKRIDERLAKAATSWFEKRIAENGATLTPYAFGAQLRSVLGQEGTFAAAVKEQLYDSVRALPDTVNFDRLLRGLTDRGVTGASNQGIKEAVLALGRIKDHLKLDRGTLPMTDAALVSNASNWSQVSTRTALEVRRELNKLDSIAKKGTSPDAKLVWGDLAEAAREDIRSSLSTGGRQALVNADAFFGQYQDRINQPLVKLITAQFKKQPAQVLGYFDQSKSADFYSRLLELKNLFVPAAGTPTRLGQQAYEDTILKPVRTSILQDFFENDKAIGLKLNGAKAAATLEKMETESPEFTYEIFGGKDNFQRYRNFASAAMLADAPVKPTNTMVLRLVQGGQFAAALMGLAGVTGAVETIQRYGWPLTIITALPIALASLASNPTRLRIVTEGIVAGPGSKAFNRMAIQLALANKEGQTNLQRMEPTVREFFTAPLPFSATQQPQQPEGMIDYATRKGRELRGAPPPGQPPGT